MTTLKRIVAVLLAVMLIASICAVSVSAAEVETLKITISKPGFTYTVYKIADLVKVDGKIKDGSYSFPAGVDTSVQNVVKATQTATSTKTAGAVFRDQLDAIYNNGKGASKFGTALADKVTSTTPVSVTQEGIYYAVVTGTPVTYKEVNNVVIVWPEYKNNNWDYMTDANKEYTVDISGKVSDGSDYFNKYFSEDFGKPDAEKAVSKLLGQTDVVSFTLEGDIVGSYTQQLKKFEFTDVMCPGLTYNNDLHVYYGTASAINKSSNIDALFTIDVDAPETAGSADTNFTITANADTLKSADFYNANNHTKVYIIYTATVNNAAVVGEDGNPNTAQLDYTNASNVDKTLGPKTRTVFTFNVDALKSNASTNQPLGGATFVIGTGKNSDGQVTGVIASGISADGTGKVEFKKSGDSNPYRFAPGTYYVQETAAPSSFALSTVIYTVTISDDLSVYSDATSVAHVNNNEAIKNYPVKLPETGGAGTMMFTIIGGILVLAAGVMFVIIMKKRASSK